MYHVLFIRSFTDGHLGGFYILAIINEAAMHMGCMYLFELVFPVSLAVYSEVESLGH